MKVKLKGFSYGMGKGMATLEGGQWSALCSSNFIPKKDPLAPTEKEAAWAPEPV